MRKRNIELALSFIASLEILVLYKTSDGRFAQLLLLGIAIWVFLLFVRFVIIRRYAIRLLERYDEEDYEDYS